MIVQFDQDLHSIQYVNFAEHIEFPVEALIILSGYVG